MLMRDMLREVVRLHAEELRHPADGPRPGSRGAPPGEGDLVWREVPVPAEARLDGGWVALARMRCIVYFLKRLLRAVWCIFTFLNTHRSCLSDCRVR